MSRHTSLTRVRNKSRLAMMVPVTTAAGWSFSINLNLYENHFLQSQHILEVTQVDQHGEAGNFEHSSARPKVWERRFRLWVIRSHALAPWPHWYLWHHRTHHGLSERLLFHAVYYKGLWVCSFFSSWHNPLMVSVLVNVSIHLHAKKLEEELWLLGGGD